MADNSGRYPGAPRIETALDSSAVDIKLKQDCVDFLHGEPVLECPLDDIQVLPTVFEELDDRVEQWRGVAEPA